MNKILLDMDGVIVRINPILLERVNEKFGTDYKEQDLKNFDYYKTMDEEHASYILKEWHDPDLYNNVEWAEGAENGVKKLKSMGEVTVVSSPMAGHATSKLYWLENHGFSMNQVVLTSNKSLVRGDLLIDDHEDNVDTFPNSTILVDKPYNKCYNSSYRAHSWDEIVSYTELILKGD